MTKVNYIQKAVSILFIVVICVLVSYVFKKCSSQDTTYYDEAMKSKDSLIHSLEKQNGLLFDELKVYQEKDEALAKADSIQNAKNDQANKLYKLINDKLQINTITISRISGNKDSVRAAYREY